MHCARAHVQARSAYRIECTARQRPLNRRGALTAWRPEPQPGASTAHCIEAGASTSRISRPKSGTNSTFASATARKGSNSSNGSTPNPKSQRSSTRSSTEPHFRPKPPRLTGEVLVEGKERAEPSIPGLCSHKITRITLIALIHPHAHVLVTHPKALRRSRTKWQRCLATEPPASPSIPSSSPKALLFTLIALITRSHLVTLSP